MVLIKERTRCAVTDREDGDPTVRDEVSEQALVTICLNIDRRIYGLVRNAKTANEIPTSTVGPPGRLAW